MRALRKWLTNLWIEFVWFNSKLHPSPLVSTYCYCIAVFISIKTSFWLLKLFRWIVFQLLVIFVKMIVEFITFLIAPKSFLSVWRTSESNLVIDNTSSKNAISRKVFESTNSDWCPINSGLGFWEIMSSNTSTMTVHLSQHLLQAAPCDCHLVTEVLIMLSVFIP